MQVKPTREEYQISEAGLVHEPTEYSFVPYPGTPLIGNVRQGILGKPLADGRVYRDEDVKELAARLWAEYQRAK